MEQRVDGDNAGSGDKVDGMDQSSGCTNNTIMHGETQDEATTKGTDIRVAVGVGSSSSECGRQCFQFRSVTPP